ncbi:hypothetical protein HNR46_003662 [Haloferula luteola]|uniref:Uncharacterized protein n=1 Tax=Haloferula luteola TaxID=595692 RepID=A0A840V5V8_9BACT|nr:hypothetical protein [Haloferula luteola]MBB5353405.1 hypothetical protein [Haloferula luteola]
MVFRGDQSSAPRTFFEEILFDDQLADLALEARKVALGLLLVSATGLG